MTGNQLSQGQDEEAKVDRALSLLRTSATPEIRFEVLQAIVRYWHGPIGVQDGLTTKELEGLYLPQPLSKWYRWAGRRSEIMSGQNFLFSPQEQQYEFRKLRLDTGCLLFQIENQGVCEWATLPEGEDPPVFCRFNNESWQRESVSLSEHLILTCLFEAVVCHALYSASSAWISSEQLEAIVENFSPLAISPWRWSGATRFYAGDGVFICTARHTINGEVGASVWIGAKKTNRLDFLVGRVGYVWDRFKVL